MNERQERRIVRLPHEIALEYRIGPRKDASSRAKKAFFEHPQDSEEHREIEQAYTLLDILRKGERQVQCMDPAPEVRFLMKKNSFYLILDDERSKSKKTVEAMEKFLAVGAIPQRVKEIYPIELEEEVCKAFERRGYELLPRFMRRFFGYEVQPIQKAKIISIFHRSAKRHTI